MKTSKLYGTIALKFGLTQRTFNDYLEALEAAGQINKRPDLIRIGEDLEITLVSKR